MSVNPNINTQDDSEDHIDPINQSSPLVETSENPLNIENDASPEASTLERKLAEEDVARLQEQILSDKNFDFAALEATAAGENSADSSYSPTIGSQSLSSPIIESFSIQGNNTALDNSHTISFEQDGSVKTSSTLGPGQGNPDERSIEDESYTPHAASNTNNQTGDHTFESVTEDIQTVAQGQLTSTHSFSEGYYNSQYGVVHIDDQGHWQYLVNNSSAEVQTLGAGDTLHDAFSLTNNAGQQFTITITINGSNDKPTITGTSRFNINEDGTDHESESSTLSGKLEIQDIDSGEARFVFDTDIATRFGTASIDGQGNWHYDLNTELSAVQGLREGEVQFDFFIVNTLDGSSETIVVSIAGTNDAPIISGSNLSNINLDQSLEAFGKLHIDDADFGQSHFIESSNIEAKYGKGSISEQGEWRYSIDPNSPEIASLEQDGILYDSFTVSSADGTQQQVIVIIEGSDSSMVASDAPIIELTTDSQLMFIEETDITNQQADLYIWDSVSENNSTTDEIAFFTPGEGGDTLQLNDLLIDSNHQEDLDQYLHFSFDGKDTTIDIYTEGSDSVVAHHLVLNNVDLTAFGNSDSEIIQHLVQQGNLDIVSAA